MTKPAPDDDALRRARSYDDVAESYERVNAPLMFDAPARALVECAGLQPDSRVLDVGSGTGAVARATLALARPAQVVSLDPSLSMLLAAKRGRVADTVVGALPWLPFPAASFDAVLAAFVMTHVDDADAAARDMRRVLRPGGCVALSAWVPSEDEYSAAWSEVVYEFVTPDRLADAALRVLPNEPRFSKPEGLPSLLEAHAFDVRRELRSFTFDLTVGEMLVAREVCATGRALRMLLSGDEWEAYKTRVREVLGKRFPDGVRYERQVIIAVGRC